MIFITGDSDYHYLHCNNVKWPLDIVWTYNMTQSLPHSHSLNHKVIQSFYMYFIMVPSFLLLWFHFPLAILPLLSDHCFLISFPLLFPQVIYSGCCILRCLHSFCLHNFIRDIYGLPATEWKPNLMPSGILLFFLKIEERKGKKRHLGTFPVSAVFYFGTWNVS